VPDASRIAPPVRHPADGPINPVSLMIDLLPGVPSARVESAYHPIVTQREPDGRHRTTLQEGAVFGDRDFELRWQPDVGQTPAASTFSERQDGEAYTLFMVIPPDHEAPVAVTPSPAVREVVFVIDTSGSMFGESIQQARAALTLALDRLAAADTFNVIQFNDVTRSLFAAPRPATRENIARARRYVAGLRATEGTEMRPALERALGGTERPGRLRQIVFLTDGQIGNEAELFETIRQRLGDRRLFTVGIGSAAQQRSDGRPSLARGAVDQPGGAAGGSASTGRGRKSPH
jgi:Ca-activated chloride channel family protein